jgi:hypothetical protein
MYGQIFAKLFSSWFVILATSQTPLNKKIMLENWTQMKKCFLSIHHHPSIHPSQAVHRWALVPHCLPLRAKAFSEVGYEAVQDMLHTEKNL